MREETVLLSPLGKETTYISHYNRDLLFPIPRQNKREEIRVPARLPFKGVDIWNAYELSWLNPKGKPVVALGEFILPCESPNVVESKSLKLYLNSFTNTHFSSIDEVTQCIQQDLSAYTGDTVTVNITPIEEFSTTEFTFFSGICLDNLDITFSEYHVIPTVLTTESTVVTETVYSNLLKSNCLVTGQPDWGSVQIHYTGNKIQHEGLLQYLVSFRNHNEFHEQCVERIFMDILAYCQPQQLSVHACYTRRGGLDINPFRSTERTFPQEKGRQVRQ